MFSREKYVTFTETLTKSKNKFEKHDFSSKKSNIDTLHNQNGRFVFVTHFAKNIIGDNVG